MNDALPSFDQRVEQLLEGETEGLGLDPVSQDISRVFSMIPAIVPTRTAPPFLKERIMARVRAEAATASATSQGFSATALRWIGEKTDALTAIAGRVYQSTKAMPRYAMAFGLAGIVLASAYAYDAVKESLAPEHHASVVSHQTVTRKPVTSPSVNAPAAPSAALHHSAALAPLLAERHEIASLPAKGESTSYQLNNAVSIAAQKNVVTDENLQTNFSLTEAYLYFTTAKDKHQCDLNAMPSMSGTGELLWDDSHGDALLRVENLAPTDANSHYVLSYVLNDGSQERLLTFSAASDAEMSFFLRHPPGPRVESIRLSVESTGAASSVQNVLTSSTIHR